MSRKGFTVATVAAVAVVLVVFTAARIELAMETRKATEMGELYQTAAVGEWRHQQMVNGQRERDARRAQAQWIEDQRRAGEDFRQQQRQIVEDYRDGKYDK